MSGKANNLSREIDSSKKKVSTANGGFGSDRRNWEESELLSPEQLHTLVNTRHELLWQEQRQERILPRAKYPVQTGVHRGVSPSY